MRRPPYVNNNFWGGSARSFAADQREAPRRPPVSPFPRKGFFFALADSPRFHSHSVWSRLLRCQLGFSIFNGC